MTRKSKRNKENSYYLEEEVTINVNSLLKINLTDLGLNYMNLNSDLLKLAISKQLDSMFRYFGGFEPVVYKVNITSRKVKSKAIKRKKS
jgi:hypothetical protein